MRTNKWLIGGLVLSLIVNLLLVGFMAGRMSGFGPPPAFGPDPTAGFFRLLGFLPDERRVAIAPDLRKQMGELLPMLRKMRGDQREVFETLTAEPFDAAALEAWRDYQAMVGTGAVDLDPGHGARPRLGLAAKQIVKRGAGHFLSAWAIAARTRHSPA